MNVEKEDIATIRFNIILPDKKLLSIWSKKYPQLTFKILSMLPISKNHRKSIEGVNIVSIEGINVKSIITELENFESELTYNILYNSSETLLISIIMVEPLILENLVKIGIPLQYPVVITNGIANVGLLTERKKIDKFLTELEMISIDFEIKEIGHYKRKSILTGAQRDILILAYKEGLFEIPRKKSMSKFAGDLEISPSHVSEILRRIFKRLAKNYLGN